MNTYLSKYIKDETQIKNVSDKIKKYNNPDEILYEVLGQLSENVPISTIMYDLENTNKLNWNSKLYTNFKNARNAIDKAIENPIEIKEGDIQCPKCKLKKTVIVELQTRSADEGSTYEIHCLNQECKYVKRTNIF
jgi:DNA-directed RNA polymerase subunit M/transcription elongation factor TFIIS